MASKWGYEDPHQILTYPKVLVFSILDRLPSELQLASKRPFLGLRLARRRMTVEVEMFGEYRERIRELKLFGLKAWLFPGK